jgi:hypothetical protein
LTTAIDIARLALSQIGQQVSISSFSDTSPAGKAAQLLYTPTITMLLRAAPWGFARAQIALTLWKSATVNGVPSTTPPPQPWGYEYQYPNDCLKLRFIQPTMPAPTTTPPLMTGMTAPQWLPQGSTTIPFVEGTDFDDRGNVVRVVLTDLAQAQAVYVRDLSQFPDTWDPMFVQAASAMLASYFINALARNAAQMNQQMAMAKSLIESARVANANEAITSIDHQPDWIRARRVSAVPWMWGAAGSPANPGMYGQWDAAQFPDGQSF